MFGHKFVVFQTRTVIGLKQSTTLSKTNRKIFWLPLPFYTASGLNCIDLTGIN